MNMRAFLTFRSAVLLVAASAVGLAAGCARSSMHGSAAASAPTLSEDSPAHIRGVSDPNAQFTLIDRTARPATPQPSVDAQSGPACDASALRVYEVAAQMDGDSRIVKLAFVNRGETACALAGFPSIALFDDAGRRVAGIAIQQTGSMSFSGRVEASASPTQAPLKVLLAPRGEAYFQIGWSTGDQCPTVSRFSVKAPGAVDLPAGETDDSFTIDRPLTVCGGQMRITEVVPAQSSI